MHNVHIKLKQISLLLFLAFKVTYAAKYLTTYNFQHISAYPATHTFSFNMPQNSYLPSTCYKTHILRFIILQNPYAWLQNITKRIYLASLYYKTHIFSSRHITQLLFSASNSPAQHINKNAFTFDTWLTRRSIHRFGLRIVLRSPEHSAALADRAALSHWLSPLSSCLQGRVAVFTLGGTGGGSTFTACHDNALTPWRHLRRKAQVFLFA